MKKNDELSINLIPYIEIYYLFCADFYLRFMIDKSRLLLTVTQKAGSSMSAAQVTQDLAWAVGMVTNHQPTAMGHILGCLEKNFISDLVHLQRADARHLIDMGLSSFWADQLLNQVTSELLDE